MRTIVLIASVAVGLFISGTIATSRGQTQAPERLIPLPPAEKPVNYAQPQREYIETNLSGWVVFLEKPSSIKTSNEMVTAVARLKRKLDEATNALPAASHALLGRLKIFVMEGSRSPFDGRDSGSAYFQPNASKFSATMDPRWDSGIVIYSAENYGRISEFWALKSLVHELAHAWHLEQWPEMQPDIRAAWLNATDLGLYHDVMDEYGKKLKTGYAAVNQLEYFAELSCMYFVGCNYEPTNRASLENYDPVGFALVQKMWGIEEGVESFDLRDVRLLDGPFKKAMELNSRYLLSLEPDRFLCYFRTEAGLEPKAPAYGGWEAPHSGAGRCLGHYLSALAMQFRATGDARFKQRVDYIVDQLALCQQTNGLLTAQAGVRKAFAELAQGKGDALRKVRVPWYIQHKMFAGLRDAYELAGNETAKTILLRMSDWAVEVTQALDETQFQIMLDQEHGGMREVLADVYAISGNTKHLALANRFAHRKILSPLMEGRDELSGLHANTQIPKLIGSARIYELTGDPAERSAAEFFWICVVHHHTYAIGGDSDDEHFGPPDQLARHLTAVACETCNTYNMLKLTRHLFAWNPRVELADFYERALYNQILASQEPQDGMFTYYVSLKPGHFRTYSTPKDSFWCCVGTGMENHTQYGNSIYFHGSNTLFVNLFIPSELTWKDEGLVLRQETQYPESDQVNFTFSCRHPVSLKLNIRYPGWALPGLNLKINGQTVATSAEPGAFISLERQWNDGDKIEMKIPMGLHTETLPDDPHKMAIFYGPLLLGGQLGTNGLPGTLQAPDQGKFRNLPDPEVPVLLTGNKPVRDWLKPVAGHSLTFQTDKVGRPHDVTLVPFYSQYYERYTVYWDLTTYKE